MSECSVPEGGGRHGSERLLGLDAAALRAAQGIAAMTRGDRGGGVDAERLLEPFRRLAGGLRVPGDDLPPGATHHHVPADHPTWRIGILALGAGARIPLHDHPGAYALGLVIRGSVWMRSFALVERPSVRRARLRPQDDQRLVSGNVSLNDPWRANLHALEADAGGCRMVTARFAIGTALESSSLYFPVPGDADRDALVSAVVIGRSGLGALADAHRSGSGADSRSTDGGSISDIF